MFDNHENINNNNRNVLCRVRGLHEVFDPHEVVNPHDVHDRRKIRILLASTKTCTLIISYTLQPFLSFVIICVWGFCVCSLLIRMFFFCFLPFLVFAGTPRWCLSWQSVS